MCFSSVLKVLQIAEGREGGHGRLAMSSHLILFWRTAAMTKTEAKPAIAAVNELFVKSPDGLREIVRAVMQEMLEAEMTDALGAEKGERTAGRLGYRSGYYTRTLGTGFVNIAFTTGSGERDYGFARFSPNATLESITYDPPGTAVPEPPAWELLIAGAGIAGLLRRGRRRSRLEAV
jgi:hypothetical protein